VLIAWFESPSVKRLMKDLICIGAGISGSLLCHLLKDHCDLMLVDKSRGPGGRMSTRRVEVDRREYRFDHGAQFLTARDSRFQAVLARPLELGVIKPWHSAIPHLSHQQIKESPRFCGSAGMNSLAKYFSSGVESRFNWKCAALVYANSHWKLVSAEGETLECKTLVLATPLPQALSLLAGTAINLKRLSSVRFHPTWAVMFGALDGFLMPSPHAQWCNPETGIEWICDNQKKGISENPSLTVHLTQEKSLEMINASAAEVIEFAKSQLKSVLPKALVIEAAHRWLYSRSEPLSFDVGDFHFDEISSLYVIGDAFQGGRVEGAALSALEAVESIKKQMS